MVIEPKPALVIALGIALPVVDIVIVGLRFYAKSKLHRSVYKLRRYGIDDLFSLMSLLLTIALGIVITYGTVLGGFGHSLSVETQAQGFTNMSDILVSTKRLVFVCNILYPWVFGFAKLSLLFYYRTLFRSMAFSIASAIIIGIVSVVILLQFFFSLFQCGIHVDFLWTSAANIAQKCIAGFEAVPFAAVDVATDLMVLILPLFWVYGLRLSRFKKIALGLIFLFGSITIISSLARLIVFSVVYPQRNRLANQLAYLTTIAYWGVLEAGLGVIAACLPTLGPLFCSNDCRTGNAGAGAIFALHLERAWCKLRGKGEPEDPRDYYANGYVGGDDVDVPIESVMFEHERSRSRSRDGSILSFWRRKVSRDGGTVEPSKEETRQESDSSHLEAGLANRQGSTGSSGPESLAPRRSQRSLEFLTSAI